MFAHEYHQWSPQEKRDRQTRQQVKPTQQQFQSLTQGAELTADELQTFAHGLVAVVAQVAQLPMDSPLVDFWSESELQSHALEKAYRLSVMRSVLRLAEAIMGKETTLAEDAWAEHRLLVEFYWMVHKLPEYLLRTDSQDTAFESKFMGERVSGSQRVVGPHGRRQVCRCANPPAAHGGTAGRAGKGRLHPPGPGLEPTARQGSARHLHRDVRPASRLHSAQTGGDPLPVPDCPPAADCRHPAHNGARAHAPAEQGSWEGQIPLDGAARGGAREERRRPDA